MGIAKRTLDYAQTADAPCAKMLKCGVGSQFGALTSMTSVVADTGDFEKTKNFRFEDATTNPTLLLEVAQMPEYENLLQRAIEYGKDAGLAGEDLATEVCDKLTVSVGCEILKVVPGSASAQFDASLSSNTAGSLAKAKKLIRMYERAGVSKERTVIKLESTWQSMMACRQLQKEGIKCNMPHPGSAQGEHREEAHHRGGSGCAVRTEDLPVLQKFGYTTIEMGAAFRSAVEILDLAGSDQLTIGPQLLRELQNTHAAAGVEQKQDPEICKRDASIQKLEMSENIFRWVMKRGSDVHGEAPCLGPECRHGFEEAECVHTVHCDGVFQICALARSRRWLVPNLRSRRRRSVQNFRCSWYFRVSTHPALPLGVFKCAQGPHSASHAACVG